jgi:hypothetical protein
LAVSTTTLHIIELVKSLPEEEQRTICAALTGPRATAARPKRRQLQRLPDGAYLNPDGIPNDDPLFKVLEGIEAERHVMPGPPPPAFD